MHILFCKDLDVRLFGHVRLIERKRYSFFSGSYVLGVTAIDKDASCPNNEVHYQIVGMYV